MASAPSAVERVGGTAALLALVAGYVDAYAVLNHEVFVSFMSGNTTNTGRYVGDGAFQSAWQALLPILLFVAGVFTGTVILHGRVPRPARWVLALAALLVLATLLGRRFASLPSWSDVSLLALAMGLMSPTITKVGAQSVGLGYVTGTLNNAAQHFALAAKRLPVPQSQGDWDTHGRRVALLLGMWACFVIGAILGAIATERSSEWALLLPVGILTAVAIVGYEPG